MNSVFTFPSMTYGMPQGWFGAPMIPEQNQFVGMTPFHARGMEQARQRVADRARINAHNQAIYGIGGYRNQIAKPQPQGAFYRPAGGTFGANAGYGMTGGAYHGEGGSFRTREGQMYGIDRLKARGRQLEELALAKEEGLPVSQVAMEQPVPLSKTDADMTAFDLLLNELEGKLVQGQEGSGIEEIDTSEVRKMFGLLKQMLLDLTLDDLKEYQRRIGDITTTFVTVLQSEYGDDLQGERPSVYKKIENVKDVLFRMGELLKVAIASINKQPKERKKFISAFTKDISRKKVEDLAGAADEVIEKLAKVPNYLLTEEATQRANYDAEVADAQDLAFDGGDDDSWDAGVTRVEYLTDTMSGSAPATNTGLHDHRFSSGAFAGQSYYTTAHPGFDAYMAAARNIRRPVALQQSPDDDFSSSSSSSASSSSVSTRPRARHAPRAPSAASRETKVSLAPGMPSSKVDDMTVTQLNQFLSINKVKGRSGATTKATKLALAKKFKKGEVGKTKRGRPRAGV